jgi:hypothetical protein
MAAVAENQVARQQQKTQPATPVTKAGGVSRVEAGLIEQGW